MITGLVPKMAPHLMESGVEQWGSGFGLETDAVECGRV